MVVANYRIEGNKKPGAFFRFEGRDQSCSEGDEPFLAFRGDGPARLTLEENGKGPCRRS